MADQYDVFVSYAHFDAEAVRPIAAALSAAGLRVWFDAVIDNEFKSITRAIQAGLANSKAVVAYYSRTYVTRRACQWELTLAFLAAQAVGDPRERILVVNPHDDADHLQPVELRDAIYRQAPAGGDADALRDLAAAVKRRLDAIDRRFGELSMVVPPLWHGASARGTPRFAGRLTEMWALHSGLHAQFAAITTSERGIGLTQLRGLGGTGKSLLVEEYALRFGAAYPGGVFWLRAFGHDNMRVVPDRMAREAQRDTQLRDFASGLGLKSADADPAHVRGLLARAIEEGGQQCLWVVDDLPSGMARDEQDLWVAPHPLARTVVTTRSREYELGMAIDLADLGEQDAFELLTARRTPGGAAEAAAARQIVSDLGYHALAIDVAGGALHALKGFYTFGSYRAELARPTEAGLRLAEKLGPQLPNGHEKSIADTLLRSIDRLGTDGRQLLRLASVLGAAPIPPQLITLTFAQALPGKPIEAAARAAAACDEAVLLSLAQRLDDESNSMRVHPLVSRTIQLQDDPGRQAVALRTAAITALTLTFVENREAVSAGDTTVVAPLIPHVTAITRDLAAIDVDPKVVGLLINAAAGVMVDSGRLSAAEEITTRALALAGRMDARDLGILRHQRATIIFSRGRVAEAIDAYNEAVYGVTDEQLDDELQAKVLTDLSMALKTADRLDEALVAARQALELDERRIGEEHYVIANDLSNLGMVLRAAGKYDEARRCYERALRITQAARRERLHQKLHGSLLHNLAVLLVDIGDLSQARRTYHQSLTLKEQLKGPDSVEVAVSLSGLGTVAHKLGDLPAAHAYLRRGLNIVERQDEQYPTLEADLLSELGQVQREAGQWREAFATFTRVKQLDEATVGSHTLKVAEDYNNLGVTLQNAGYDTDAQEHFASAIEIRRALPHGQGVNLVQPLVNRSTSLYRLGEYEAAARELLEAKDIVESLPSPPAATLTRVYTNLAPVFRVLGRLPEARDAAERALALRRAAGERGPEMANDLLSLGWILFDMGERAQSLEIIGQALSTMERSAGAQHPQTDAIRKALRDLAERQE